MGCVRWDPGAWRAGEGDYAACVRPEDEIYPDQLIAQGSSSVYASSGDSSAGDSAGAFDQRRMPGESERLLLPGGGTLSGSGSWLDRSRIERADRVHGQQRLALGECLSGAGYR